MKRVFGLFVGSVCLLGFAATAGFAGLMWSTQTVDSSAQVGSYTSLALDSSDYPHITYYDETNHDLQYAYMDAGGWHFETVDGASSDAGKWSSLALDSSGWAHVSYYDETNDTLRYAYRTGLDSWSFSDVHAGAGEYCSLVLDSSQYPHISYHRGASGGTIDDLYYASYDGSVWTKTELEHSSTFDTTEFGLYTSIALDSSGYAHISECRNEGGLWEELRYLYEDGSGWHSENGPVRGTVGEFDGRYTSIVLDSNDVPHISYEYLDVGVQYATWDGSWHVQTVDADGLRPGTSIVLDSDENPHISYHGVVTADSSLMYARYDGSNWTIEPANTPDAPGRWSSLALDSAGWPHISHQSWIDFESGHELRYTHGIPEPSTSFLMLVGLGIAGLFAARRRDKE